MAWAAIEINKIQTPNANNSVLEQRPISIFKKKQTSCTIPPKTKKREPMKNLESAYRTHHCGALRTENVGQEVTLSGWVQRNRDLGGMTFIDLRDRYGITQLAFNMETNERLCLLARKLGREFVIQATGKVKERSSKNKNIATGEIEIVVEQFHILKAAAVPPFTIETETDGGDDLRMKYRYLDIRRNPVKEALILRHKMALQIRQYLDAQAFIEAETPVLIKSTPEGARDFVVPSRMNPGQFYALPQSPQVFKQLLMVGGLDRYYQIVKCFRDEDLRADRQPEFTQIDCEMSFVEQEDVLNMFEGLSNHLFKTIKGLEINQAYPRLTYDEAMEKYGNDKPDIRFEMFINDLSEVVKGQDFQVFDTAEYIGAIVAKGASEYTRKNLDALTNFVKQPQVGAKGMVYVKCNADGSFKSSVDKFYDQQQLAHWAQNTGAQAGDLILLLSGNKAQTLSALSKLRLEMGRQLGLMNPNHFAPLWVVDFPLLEWDDETQRFHAKHHPFTAPKPEHLELLDTNPRDVKANAYDLVINGVEIGGGSIRIFDTQLQKKMFDVLGFTPEEARAQFGFLMDAFQYGAPPHGGAAFGLDRWVALFNGSESIRDVIAFPKNNAGRDIMIDAPAPIDNKQLDELQLKITEKK